MNAPSAPENSIHQNLQNIERKLDHLHARIREADHRINGGIEEWDQNDPDEKE